MKNNESSDASGGPGVQLVRFEYTHPTASTFGVAGTFNNWRPDATPMLPWGHSRWLMELLLAPGRYEYRLVVDGEWMTDPLAQETVPNPFGGRNSILKVESAPEGAPPNGKVIARTGNPAR